MFILRFFLLQILYIFKIVFWFLNTDLGLKHMPTEDMKKTPTTF